MIFFTIESTPSSGYTPDGGARLSHGRDYVAMVVEDYDDKRHLALYTRKGEMIDISNEEKVYSFDWLPDKRIVYGSDHAI